MSLELPSAGAEYFYWTVSARNPITFSVFVAFLKDGVSPGANTRWSAATWFDGVSTLRTMRALVAGPNCSSLPVGAVQLPIGEFVPWIKIASDPEAIILKGTESIIVK